MSLLIKFQKSRIGLTTKITATRIGPGRGYFLINLYTSAFPFLRLSHTNLFTFKDKVFLNEVAQQEKHGIDKYLNKGRGLRLHDGAY